MCNCSEEISKKAIEHVQDSIQDEPGFQGITDSYFSHQTFVLAGNSLTTVPIMIPFKVEYTRKAKTSGNVRTYKKETNIKPSHCPFCGEKYQS